jgi:CHAT domain/Ternary complex associated domain 7
MTTLQDLMGTDFFMVGGDTPVGDSLDLIKTHNPSHLVIRRSVESEPYLDKDYFYLLKDDELLERLGGDLTQSIRDALNLREYMATPEGNAGSTYQALAEPRVVTRHGKVVGYYDPAAKRGEPGQQGGSGAVPPELGTQRTLVADLPQQIRLAKTADLQVSITDDPGAAGVSLNDLPAGTSVDIIVSARRGFVVVGVSKRRLKVVENGETLPVLFQVKATELGDGELRVTAYHKGLALGVLILQPTVVDGNEGNNDDALEKAPPPVRAQRLHAPPDAAEPDCKLSIEEGYKDGKRCLDFRLTVRPRGGRPGYDLKRFGPVFLEKDPGEHFQELYSEIEDFPVATSAEREETLIQLANVGTNLFERLFPNELQQRLWDSWNVDDPADRITSIFIQSHEPWIPWELCKLIGRQNGKIVEGPFLCEAFELTRWFPSLGYRTSLSLDNVAVVVPQDSKLPFAATELSYLLSLKSAQERKVTQVPAQFATVIGALSEGTYDGWHFSGHGAFSADDPDKCQMILEQGKWLTPGNLTGKTANFGNAHPVVFLNACQIGQGGMSLTDIGGWASRFLRAGSDDMEGAGAFIGAFWSIYDEAAFSFAKALYTRLLGGMPIGRAVKEARQEIKKPDDPTWLAYTVFAHPFATIGDGSEKNAARKPNRRTRS